MIIRRSRSLVSRTLSLIIECVTTETLAMERLRIRLESARPGKDEKGENTLDVPLLVPFYLSSPKSVARGENELWTLELELRRISLSDSDVRSADVYKVCLGPIRSHKTHNKKRPITKLQLLITIFLESNSAHPFWVNASQRLSAQAAQARNKRNF